jgi:hypothetical protein
MPIENKEISETPLNHRKKTQAYTPLRNSVVFFVKILFIYVFLLFHTFHRHPTPVLLPFSFLHLISQPNEL